MSQHVTDPLAAEQTSTGRPRLADTDSTSEHTGEGVNAMARRWSRKGARTRAWDEMSQTDREVLLESVRLRRQAQAVHDAQELQAWAARMHR